MDKADLNHQSYATHYHPFLPFLDMSRTPHDYGQTSELLFWCIMAVASRHSISQPMMLQKLTHPVSDLLWKNLRASPYSLRTVQSLALLCTWPFPVSSSMKDPTPILIGCMVQAGTHIGLHCALNAQDFARVPTRLDASQQKEWVRTWQACNIIARRSVSWV